MTGLPVGRVRAPGAHWPGRGSSSQQQAARGASLGRGQRLPRTGLRDPPPQLPQLEEPTVPSSCSRWPLGEPEGPEQTCRGEGGGCRRPHQAADAPGRGVCTPGPHFACLPRCPGPPFDGCQTCPPSTVGAWAPVQPEPRQVQMVGRPCWARQGQAERPELCRTGRGPGSWRPCLPLAGQCGPHTEGENQKSSRPRRLLRPCPPQLCCLPAFPPLATAFKGPPGTRSGDESSCSGLTSVKGIIRAHLDGTRDRFRSAPGCRLLVKRKDLRGF